MLFKVLMSRILMDRISKLSSRDRGQVVSSLRPLESPTPSSWVTLDSELRDGLLKNSLRDAEKSLT